MVWKASWCMDLWSVVGRGGEVVGLVGVRVS